MMNYLFGHLMNDMRDDIEESLIGIMTSCDTVDNLIDIDD